MRNHMMGAVAALLLATAMFVERAEADDLKWACGEYSFLGGSKVYSGMMSNGRKAGLVLLDARSERGRVLALYVFGTRPDGSGGQGCWPRFGQIDGDTLIVPIGRQAIATYVFDESSGSASMEWTRKHRSGKVEKLTAKLKAR